MDVDTDAAAYAVGTIILASGLFFLSAMKYKQDRLRRERARGRRQIWTREWLQRRDQGRGVLNLVHNELRVEDTASFRNFLRMPSSTFDELLSYVEGDIRRSDTHMRTSITPADRLSVTLRFLATGEAYRSLMYSTRIHYSTLSLMIPEVCRIIYQRLKSLGYVKCPRTPEEWKSVAQNFMKKWNYPLCLGGIDGKHVAFRAPRNKGSYYFNYKGFNSLVLMAVVDADYKFLYADAGVNGRISDGGVLRHSSFYDALMNGKLNLPEDEALPGRERLIPYHFVGDDAFSLSTRLMKPFPYKDLAPDKKIFNKSLSRARVVVENAFGILSNRFRVLLTTINLPPEKVQTIILTCVALHNFLATTNASYIDADDMQSDLVGLRPELGHNAPNAAKNIREELKAYFVQNARQ